MFTSHSFSISDADVGLQFCLLSPDFSAYLAHQKADLPYMPCVCMHITVWDPVQQPRLIRTDIKQALSLHVHRSCSSVSCPTNTCFLFTTAIYQVPKGLLVVYLFLMTDSKVCLQVKATLGPSDNHVPCCTYTENTSKSSLLLCFHQETMPTLS